MNTKSRKFSVRWTVVTGPDRSHLTDVQVFDKLSDACAAFDSLKDRPRQLWRHRWRNPFSQIGDKKLIRESYP